MPPLFQRKDKSSLSPSSPCSQPTALHCLRRERPAFAVRRNAAFKHAGALCSRGQWLDLGGARADSIEVGVADFDDGFEALLEGVYDVRVEVLADALVNDLEACIYLKRGLVHALLRQGVEYVG